MDTPNHEPNFINVPYNKAMLRLTAMEFATAVKRGKGFLRAMAHAKREAAMGAQHEAKRLDWIEEDEKT